MVIIEGCHKRALLHALLKESRAHDCGADDWARLSCLLGGLSCAELLPVLALRCFPKTPGGILLDGELLIGGGL